jgi:hypothetical protein
MKISRRKYYCLILALAIFSFVLGGALFGGNASAFTIHGGTAEQQAAVQQTLDKSLIPVADLDRYYQESGINPAGLEVFITDAYPAKFPQNFAFLAVSADGAYSRGMIWVDSDLDMPALLAKLKHEYGHAIWAGVVVRYREVWLDSFSVLVPDYNSKVDYDPCEAFAWFGAALFGADGMTGVQALLEKRLPATPWYMQARLMRLAWYGSRGWSEFKDLRNDAGVNDEALAGAGYWLYRVQYTGNAAGYFDPYPFVSREKFYLLVWNIGVKAPTAWQDDPTLVTRGEVRDLFPDAWWADTTNWNQPITMLQLATVAYRADDVKQGLSK